MFETVKQNGSGNSLEFAPTILQQAGATANASASRSVQVRPEAPERKADREVVLKAVKQNGSVLKFASPNHKADREVVLEAVRQKRHAGYKDDEASPWQEAVMGGLAVAVLSSIMRSGSQP